MNIDADGDAALAAPIVAVHPDRARVTRRAATTLPRGRLRAGPDRRRREIRVAVEADAAGQVELDVTALDTTGTALLAGPLSASVDGVFVGATHVEPTAPGEEPELALGIDDRVAITRELVERTTGKTLLGGRLDAVETWTISARNGVHLVVRDRVPGSRHPDVQVVDVLARPEPAERDDLGRLEWRADLAAGGAWEARLRFGVRHARDLPVVGWR